MVAKTLRDAFNNFDPLRPLTPKQIPTLFVQRPHSPVKKMETHLRISDRPIKLLFVGHRGAGKSSEMAYLSTLLTNEYLTIFVPLYDIFRSAGMSYTELVFAITIRLLQQATDNQLVPRGVMNEVWEQLLERIYNPLRQQLFGADPIAADSQATFSLKLNVLVAELEAKIGTESYTRNQIKEKFEGRLAELLEQTGHLARLLEGKIGRKVLLIVEDMDKFDLSSTRALFLDHNRTLVAPYPSIIYSFPVAMRYDNSFRTIEQGFDKSYMLPNIAIKHRDGNQDETGRAILEEIILRRVDPNLFGAEVLKNLVDMSGGHVKLLIQLAQQAILNSVVDGEEQVKLPHVIAAKNTLRDDYIALLKREQLELLAQLHQDRDKDLIDTTEAKQDLLSNGSLLEYANDRGPWADVTPVVVELLEHDYR